MSIIPPDLAGWGFDDWFQARVDPERLAGFELARVLAVHKQSYLARTSQGECKAEITGRLMYGADSPMDYPTVGDWVYVQVFDDGALAVIDAVFPRKSLLKRKTPGKRVDYQLLGANLDTGFIVQGFGRDFNPRRLERYLAICHEAGLEPVVLLNKCDLAETGEFESTLTQASGANGNIKVLAISAKQGSGMAELLSLLKAGHTYCLLGSSGVGKTTLLNRLLGQEKFATEAIRDKDGKGRHTTTRRELVMLPGGALLLDSPGMRELGTASLDQGISQTFEEIENLTGDCRFADCTHTTEPGCALLAALTEGSISQKRYDNFMKMRRESEHFQSSYLEKRNKDKQFGKMVKSIMQGKAKTPR